jgi:ABC-type branched-subunit amino acid transport system substrate-binding protein
MRLLLAIASLLIALPARAETGCRPLKAGVSLPLSSTGAASGTAVKNSIILAKEKYDKRGCVTFMFEDDQLLPKNTLTIVHKFLSSNHVDALIVYGTSTSLAVGDLVEARAIPMIALSILNRVVAGRKHIMKHWCTAERLTQAVGEQVKRRGYRSIAIVSSQNDAMLGLRSLFLESKAAPVVLDEEFAHDNFDFSAVAARIIGSKADAVYVLLYPPQTAPFVKRLRVMGYRGQGFGVHNLEDPQEVQASQGAMLGMWLANADDSAGEDYKTEYLKRFGAPTALGGASGFDAAKMIIEAAYKGADLNLYLHQLRDFKGAFGVYSASPAGDFDYPAVIKTVTAEGFMIQR